MIHLSQLTDTDERSVIYNEIRRMIYDLPLHDEETSWDTDILKDVADSGNLVVKDLNEMEPYIIPWYSMDLYTLLRFHNYDVCLLGKDQAISLYFFNNRHTIHILDRSARDIVKLLLKLDDDMPKMIKKAKQTVATERKKHKMKEISKTTLTAIVKAQLKGSGIKYRLELGDQQAFLTLQLQHGLETKIRLNYKTFMQKVPHINDMVHQINSIMDVMGQPIRIKASYNGCAGPEPWEESL